MEDIEDLGDVFETQQLSSEESLVHRLTVYFDKYFRKKWNLDARERTVLVAACKLILDCAVLVYFYGPKIMASN